MLLIPRILLVRSKKLKRDKVASSESEGHDQGSETYYKPFEFYLTGNIRRYFVMNAADLNKNVVCSPVAAMLSLGKLAYGAENKTKSEILNALGIRNSARLGPSMRKVIKILHDLPGVEHYYVTSAIFASEKYKTNKEFIKKCSRTYGSFIEKVDCGNDDVAVRNINKWVCNYTRSMIGKILKSDQQICREKSLTVTNGIYFKGIWQKPFLRSYIKDFRSMVGVTKIPMMIINDVFMYGRTNFLNVQIVEIPYKASGASFIILLPYFKDGLPSVLKQLKEAPKLLNLAMKTLRPQEMILSIPKFKVTSEIDLKKLYEEVGVKTAMDPQLSGLNKMVQDETVYIGTAVQKIVLEITERGTDEEFIPPDHIEFEMHLDQVLFFADHPFLFYVTSQREQLFAGIYNGVPSANESHQNMCE